MSDEERTAHWKEIMTAERESHLPSDPIMSQEEWFELLGEAEDKRHGSIPSCQQPNNGKFHNVPDDPGTQIIFETEAEFEDFDVLFQRWMWDGIEGESLIFIANDVSHLSDEELVKKVEESALNTVKSGVTIKRNTHGYTFLNLNFEATG